EVAEVTPNQSHIWIGETALFCPTADSRFLAGRRSKNRPPMPDWSAFLAENRQNLHSCTEGEEAEGEETEGEEAENIWEIEWMLPMLSDCNILPDSIKCEML